MIRKSLPIPATSGLSCLMPINLSGSSDEIIPRAKDPSSLSFTIFIADKRSSS